MGSLCYYHNVWKMWKRSCCWTQTFLSTYGDWDLLLHFYLESNVSLCVWLNINFLQHCAYLISFLTPVRNLVSTLAIKTSKFYPRNHFLIGCSTSFLPVDIVQPNNLSRRRISAKHNVLSVWLVVVSKLNMCCSYYSSPNGFQIQVVPPT